MRSLDAESAFRAYLEQERVELDSVAAASAFRLMIGFYLSERADDAAAIEENGDMLLVQWGTYDWGHGPSFEYSMTRQLILAGEDDDDSIYQLALATHFEPSHETDLLTSGDRWCSSPADVPEFEIFIAGLPATSWTNGRSPLRVTLAMDNAG